MRLRGDRRIQICSVCQPPSAPTRRATNHSRCRVDRSHASRILRFARAVGILRITGAVIGCAANLQVGAINLQEVTGDLLALKNRVTNLLVERIAITLEVASVCGTCASRHDLRRDS